MSGERGDARKRGLAVVPCCDAAAAVARVRELAESAGDLDNGILVWDLRAALDGTADGGAA